MMPMRRRQAYGFRPRQLYRQPTRGGFSTAGTIVTIHRCGLRDRSSWTDRTMPKNLDPFKLSSAARPLYWARRQRVASRKLLVSIVCTMTSSGQVRDGISQTLTFSFVPLELAPAPVMSLPRRVEFLWLMPVDRLQYAHPGEHAALLVRFVMSSPYEHLARLKSCVSVAPHSYARDGRMVTTRKTVSAVCH